MIQPDEPATVALYPRNDAPSGEKSAAVREPSVNSPVDDDTYRNVRPVASTPSACSEKDW